MKILLVENIHSIAAERLESEGFEVEQLPHAPSEKELLKLLPDYDVLGIRSKTEITRKVLESNTHLFAIGAFCIGTNQIDLKAARVWGVPIFNAPHANTRSVAELVIAEMIALSRQLGDRSGAAHRGEWMKSANGSHEVRGKTLGIVGYGHIGSQLSVLAEAMGMRVLFYDVVKKLPLGNARPTRSLEELLDGSDFVSLHVPETLQTKNLIGKKQLAKMKKDSYLLNASRGTVVEIESLVGALKSRHLAGCAIDVFPTEPASNKEKFKSELQGLPNVLLTPHIGGSTEEAQYAIGLEVAESFRRFLKIGTTAGAVNFPNVELPPGHGTCRILNVHKNEPGVLGEINGIVSEAGANIQAQFLATDESIGYLVMDVETKAAKKLVQEIQDLERSIRTRQLSSKS
ncbi:MAG TPA: phosphoglycerate dehydrogenase [Pseudobdellovibrionaceae bacterium]|nr:phosphoglycerate dehydrogenase [Pseudobdellovibrionaceae bacterium]